MSNTIFTTINWAQSFVQNVTLIGNNGNEPSVSICSMVRNTILNPPFCWSWNRFEDTSVTTLITQQDYVVNLTNFGFLEKVSLTDSTGKTQEIKDVLNTTALAPNSVTQRPSAVSVINNIPGVSIKIRFNSTPDQVYKVTLTYQAIATQFGPYVVNAVANAVGSNTIYTGIFTPSSFTVGQPAYVTGCTNDVNNGTFLVAAVTGTILTLANSSGVTEVSSSAAAINASWAPIPDQYSDIYNNLFLAEAYQSSSEDQEAARYRQRGVAALLSKAEGLTQTQINIFRQVWLVRDAEATASTLRTQQGTQARGV